MLKIYSHKVFQVTADVNIQGIAIVSVYKYFLSEIDLTSLSWALGFDSKIGLDSKTWF